MFEAALARHAAEHASRQDIEELQAALEANRAAVGDPHAFYETESPCTPSCTGRRGNPIYPAIHEA